MPEVEFIGMKELQAAVARNPAKVVEEAKIFLQRGMAVYRAGIQSAPWKVGQSGGGAPVSSGNLLQSHGVRFDGLSASIGPGRNFPVPYAIYVHGNQPKPVKVKNKNIYTRPWLDYAKEKEDGKIQGLYKDLIQNITSDLAK